MAAALAERLRWTAYLARHWRGQARFPFQSRDVIERAQSRRVRAMIAHAYATVPFYRDAMAGAGLTPGDFHTAADLANLPVIDRAAFRDGARAFESAAPRRGVDVNVYTGGTTGLPRPITWSTAAIFQNAGHSERERSIIAGLVGKFVDYRETVIGSSLGSERDIQAIYQERAMLPAWSRVKYQHLSLLDSPARNVALINQFKPDVIRSYGSYLDRLFRYLRMSGAEFHRPKVVFYDADSLPDASRRMIGDEFGIGVLSAYQASEAFKIGFECERHTGLHLNVDLYPIRILDRNGHDVSAGQAGEVVVSNLVNDATVVLNYRLGDVAHLIGEPCPCGRTLPLLSYLEGRTDDWVVLTSGETIHPQAVRILFADESSIPQYQVVQRQTDHFTVAIAGVPPSDDLAARLKRRFAERFGAATRTDIAFVDAIELSSGGKLRPVISLVHAAQE
jgi:phenylacetate-CoA ligase